MCDLLRRANAHPISQHTARSTGHVDLETRLQHARIEKRPAPPGVFATIAVAASALVASPWPAALPAAFDAWIWQGPRLSPAAVAGPLARFLGGVPGVDPAISEAVAGWGERGDLTSLAGLFVPSLLAGADAAGFAALGTRPAVAVGAAPAAVLALLMLLLGVVGVMAFKTLLARTMTGSPLRAPGVGREILGNAGRYAAVLLLGLGAMLSVAVAAGVIAAVAGFAGVDLLPLLTLLLSAAVMAGAVLVSFVAEAIVVARSGPVAAVRLSARVVSANLLPTLGLLLATWLALFSLPQLFAPIGGNPAGLALAILVHAFVAAALALARLQFFADRYEATGDRRQATSRR